MTKPLQHSALTRDVPKGMLQSSLTSQLCAAPNPPHSVAPGTILAKKKKAEGLKAACFL